MDDIKPFPVQAGQSYRDETRRMVYPKPSSIPWWLAEIAYKEYSRVYGNTQSIERLAERGGFSREELVRFIKGINK